MPLEKFSKKKKNNIYAMLFCWVSGLIFLLLSNDNWISLIPFFLFMIGSLTLLIFMPNSFWEGKLMEELDKKNYKAYQIVLTVLSICGLAVLLFIGFIFLMQSL